MRQLRALGALVALLAGGACSAADPRPASAPEVIGYDAHVTVDVSNQSSSDMDVIAVGNGLRYRLGMVATVGTHSFVIPFQMIRSGQIVRFMAVPFGGGRPSIIGAAEVSPGDRVELTIENRLERGERGAEW